MKDIRKNKDGLILIVSLWILVIVSLVCLGLAHRVTINLKLVRFQKDKMKCLYIAKAAVQKAINVLENDSTLDTDILNELWSRGFDENSEGDGYIFKDEEMGDGIFTVSYVFDDTDSESPVYLYGMSDEDRKVNINEAEDELLKSLLYEIGASDSTALAENIIYWRGDSQGPDDSYYESPEIPYAARKAPLKTIEELSLVKGFREDPELIEKCKRVFTVYTQQDDYVNVNTASRDVLRAIFVYLEAENIYSGFSDILVNNIINYRDGNDNTEATDDDIVIYQNDIKTVLKANMVGKDDEGWIDNTVFLFTVKSNLFRIEVLAKLNTSKVQKKVTAVIDRNAVINKTSEPIKFWNEE